MQRGTLARATGEWQHGRHVPCPTQAEQPSVAYCKPLSKDCSVESYRACFVL